MRKIISFLSLAVIILLAAACKETSPFKYESVPNDPMKARIYTLDNGLKVYLTVNKETPRIQTYIAVKVGGKNDPAETTGLAHYFEHLMFKGTQKFGTQNYEMEKPLLDRIEQLFEVYRKTTDEAERKEIYHQIDSISYEASKYAIPNEYDKLMAAIGANGTNAYTGFDMTVYTEDIPSNQVDNWAKIQADRFENNVIRGFHTELETVYEEKKKTIKKDKASRLNARRQILSVLYPVTEVPKDGKKRRSLTKKVDMAAKLFDEIAPKYADRKGGYTRIIKIGMRKGDGAPEVIIELV